MSNKGRSGINRALSWLKKSLEITEKTTAPDSLQADVRPIIDVFGWERHLEAQRFDLDGAATVASVLSPVTPQGIVRWYVAAAIESTDPASLTLWINRRVLPGNIDVGISTPQVVVAAIPVALTRHVLLLPGETLVGRSEPAPAVATNLNLRAVFIDLPFGEYAPPL